MHTVGARPFSYPCARPPWFLVPLAEALPSLGDTQTDLFDNVQRLYAVDLAQLFLDK